ncbi:MAG: hypothetical protein ACKOU7_01005, partial [Ferruginibacter sp.]
MILVLLIAVCLVLYSDHPALMIFSLLSLYLSYGMFWRRYEPKLIFFGVLMSWLSITIKLFYSDLTGIRYESLSSSINIIDTTWISLVGFCCFCLGLWLAIKDLKLTNEKMHELFYNPVNFRRMLTVYIVASLVNTILKSFLFYFPGFSQLFSGFLQMKLGFLFLIVFYSFKTRRHLLLVFIIILAEVILSLFSFFSSFKDIIITAIVIIAMFPNRLSARESAFAIILSAGFLYSIFIWQSVKGDYRKFLNAGERSQTVVVSQEDALKKLQDLSEKSGSDKSGTANNREVIYQTIDRISYIEFFSQATENVPQKIPYEYGKLWKDNIMHVLQPRILFPNKEAIDDSKMVNKYATRKVATAKQGASFSLGYMAESYIDFGPYFMFIPIFLVGWLLGFIYKLIIKQSINSLWGFTMVSSLWININCNG